MNSTKSWFSEMINKIDKPLGQTDQEKQERKLKLLESELKGDITTKTKETERSTKNYYELLYGNKLDNLEVMDKFLERHKVPTPDSRRKR